MSESAVVTIRPGDIPVLRLGGLAGYDETAVRAQVEGLQTSLRDFDFCVVEGPEPSNLVRLKELAQEFFALDESVKRGLVHSQVGVVGYSPLGSEQGLRGAYPDLKELFHVRSERPPPILTRLRWPGFYPRNRWPLEQLPGFREAALAGFDALYETSRALLQLCALSLGLPRDHLAGPIEHGPNALRFVHYPAVEEPRLGEVRAVEHTGAGVLGIIPQVSSPGLELARRDGVWQRLEGFPPNALVVTMADMIERMTNGHIPSSLHRVVNPERPELNRSRHAVVFFAVARPGVMLEGPASLPFPPGMQGHRRVRAGKFLAERMNRVTHRRGGRST